MMIPIRPNSHQYYLDLIAALLVSALIASASFHAGVKGADNEEDFEYDDGPRGPHNWGNLSTEWRMCSDGRSQSPVEIKKKELVNVNKGSLKRGFLQRDANYKLDFHYTSGPATLKIRKHDVEIDWTEGGGGVNWNKTHYELLSLHLHVPSEHVINGERYPLEVHLVHEDSNKRLLVVSLLYKYGKEDVVLAQLMEEFPYLHGSGKTEDHVNNASISDMELGDQFYHYMGSLTTPPCTEGVTWIIMKKKRNVSQQQVNEILKAELGENARPLQPLNGRTIYKCDSL